MSDIVSTYTDGKVKVDTAGVTRKPVQDRSRDRVERVVAAAERLLLETGPERTSIPEVARLSNVPRASIYQFFPSKYALFLAISERHLKAVADLIGRLDLTEEALAKNGRFEFMARSITRAAADYYNDHPVASMLILGGPMSREAYLSQEVTIQDIGHQLRPLFSRYAPGAVLPQDPDVVTIAVEIAFACMKHSYFTHARIIEPMVDQAAMAASAYLRHWLEPG
ncbi:MAG: TetR family transcriptional regulator [Alteromonadaceae bacterium]|nr:TetR family transcriptional regulator [Alteromonadaceae bacterium]